MIGKEPLLLETPAYFVPKTASYTGAWALRDWGLCVLTGALGMTVPGAVLPRILRRMHWMDAISLKTVGNMEGLNSSGPKMDAQIQ